MSTETLVRGQTSGWLIAGRIFSVLAILGSCVLVCIGEGAFAVMLLTAGLLLLVVDETYAWRKRRQRCWVTDLGTGLQVRDALGSRTIADHEVLVMGFEAQPIYVNGDLSSIRRQCTVWSMTGDAPVTMDYKSPVGTADPIGEVLSRLLTGVGERLKQMRDEGEAVAGDGWRLDRQELVGKQGRQEVRIPVTEITACQEFDGKMQIWRQGQDEACLALPRGGANTCFLPALLEEQLERAAERNDDTGTLGRILFERKSRPVIQLLLHVGAIVIGIAGLGGLTAVNDAGLVVLGVVGLLIAASLEVGAWALRFSRFRCHERGVYKQNVFSRRQLRYVDVESFTYGAVRHYHNGAYVGTVLTLRFTPRVGVPSPAINYQATVHGDDSSLDDLRMFISRVICARMAQSIAAGQQVVWTPRLKLSPEGIEYVPGGFFGKKAPEFLPFAEYGGHTFQEGNFSLFRRGQPKPVVTEQSSAPNFYPGYEWLLLCLHSEEGDNAGEAGDGESAE